MDQDWLEGEFPLGDGTADTVARIVCPYCGADVEVLLDPGGGTAQRYVEDCEVCCRPWDLIVTWDEHGHARVEARGEEEGR